MSAARLSAWMQAHLEVKDALWLHASSAFTVSAWFRTEKLHGWQALFW